MKVLFVCMGNICRSPTAQGVFEARLAGSGLDVEVDSAGTHAYHVGELPDARSRAAALRRGYDLSSQRARRVEDSDFADFDLIFAMDRNNLHRLRERCPPRHQRKLSLLLTLDPASPVDEVPDPYYGEGDGFERVLDLIEGASDKLIERLRADGA